MMTDLAQIAKAQEDSAKMPPPPISTESEADLNNDSTSTLSSMDNDDQPLSPARRLIRQTTRRLSGASDRLRNGIKRIVERTTSGDSHSRPTKKRLLPRDENQSLATAAVQALASPARRFHENTKETAAKVKEKVKALQLEEKKVSAAQLYLYTAATYLLIAIIACWGVVQVLKLLARIEVVWWLTRSAQLDDFRLWTNEVCLEPWHKETVLCQAVEGNWLARELLRAKLHESDADHCSPDSTYGGCRHTPCLAKGLSKVLGDVADGWQSPLNNRFDKLFYVLLPLRSRLRHLLRGMSRGEMPLSALERELAAIPLLESKPFFLKASDNTREWLLNEHVYPLIRQWGVIIGGSRTRPEKPHECPATLDQILFKDGPGKGKEWPWQVAAREVKKAAMEVKKTAMEVQQGFEFIGGLAVNGVGGAVHGVQGVISVALEDVDKVLFRHDGSEDDFWDDVQ